MNNKKKTNNKKGLTTFKELLNHADYYIMDMMTVHPHVYSCSETEYRGSTLEDALIDTAKRCSLYDNFNIVISRFENVQDEETPVDDYEVFDISYFGYEDDAYDFVIHYRFHETDIYEEAHVFVDENKKWHCERVISE